MDPGRRTVLAERARTAVRWALFALLVLSPLPFGAVGEGAVLALELSAAALAAVALFVVRAEAAVLGRRTRLALALAAVPLVVGALQLLPLPRAVVEHIARPTASADGEVLAVLPAPERKLLASTLDPEATTDALLRYGAAVAIAFAAVVAIRGRRHLEQAMWVIVTSGAFQAAYGAAEYLSGHQHIFGYAKQFYGDEATGTFINRNHFAGYLAMTLPLALILVLRGARRMSLARTWRERLLLLAEREGTLLVVAGLAAGVIWIGVLLSYSRAGLAVALAAAAFVAHRAASRRGVRLLAVVLALPIALLLWHEVRAPGERFLSGGGELTSLHGRLPVWRATLQLVPDFLPLGSGLGTYEGAFTLYRPPEVQARWDHAHNDWLQSLAEGGPAVPLALLALFLLLMLGIGATHRSRPGIALLGSGVAAALVAAALHGLTDFGVKIPAIAVLVAALAGIICAVQEPVTSDPRPWPAREAS